MVYNYNCCNQTEGLRKVANGRVCWRSGNIS